MSKSERIDITEHERGAVIDWLQRRARMCGDSVQWWRPFRARELRIMAGTFGASARLIKECAHLAPTIGDETAAIRRAMGK